mgnify:CR=1 FL=1
MISRLRQRLCQRPSRAAVVEAALLATALVSAIAVRWVYLEQFSGTAIGNAAVGPDVKEYDAWA